MASPRQYSSHKRHNLFAHVRHSQQEKAFLKQQATRLSSTSAVVFAKVKKYGARRVKAAASLAAIP